MHDICCWGRKHHGIASGSLWTWAPLRPRGHADCETRYLAYRVRKRVLRVAGRQGKHLAARLRTHGDAVHELREFDTGRRLDPAEPCPVGAIHVNTIEEQHVEMNVQIQRTAEALDERDGTGVCRFVGLPSLFDQVRGNDTVDDAEYLTHDRRSTGEQKPQRKEKAQSPLAHGLRG